MAGRTFGIFSMKVKKLLRSDLMLHKVAEENFNFSLAKRGKLLKKFSCFSKTDVLNMYFFQDIKM